MLAQKLASTARSGLKQAHEKEKSLKRPSVARSPREMKAVPGARRSAAAAASTEVTAAAHPRATEESVRVVLRILAETYHGRGSAELGDPYKVLVATVVSQRTREEQTTAVSSRIFQRYPDAPALAQADEKELYELLSGSQYRETKALRLIQMAKILVDRFGGRVPDDVDALLELPGVGRKTANCVLIYGFDKPALCVDIHMHRITNRLGWVQTAAPDQTERALEALVPRELWIGTNRLFLQHGRAICLPGVPHCSVCPIHSYCQYGNDASTLKR